MKLKSFWFPEIKTIKSKLFVDLEKILCLHPNITVKCVQIKEYWKLKSRNMGHIVLLLHGTIGNHSRSASAMSPQACHFCWSRTCVVHNIHNFWCLRLF